MHRLSLLLSTAQEIASCTLHDEMLAQSCQHRNSNAGLIPSNDGYPFMFTGQ